MFVAARLAAAERATEPSARVNLLLAARRGRSRRRRHCRVPLFRAELAAGKPAEAIEAIQPILAPQSIADERRPDRAARARLARELGEAHQQVDRLPEAVALLHDRARRTAAAARAPIRQRITAINEEIGRRARNAARQPHDRRGARSAAARASADSGRRTVVAPGRQLAMRADDAADRGVDRDRRRARDGRRAAADAGAAAAADAASRRCCRRAPRWCCRRRTWRRSSATGTASSRENEVAGERQLRGVLALAAVPAPQGRVRRVLDRRRRAARHGAGVRRGGRRVGARALRHRQARVPLRDAAAVGESDGERAVADAWHLRAARRPPARRSTSASIRNRSGSSRSASAISISCSRREKICWPAR